jgi:hypothetical protein
MIQGKKNVSEVQNPFSFKEIVKGSGLTVLSDAETEAREKAHQEIDSEKINLAERELQEHAKNAQTVGIESVLPGASREKPRETPVVNVFNNNETTDSVTAEQIKIAVQKQRAAAEDLGMKHPDVDKHYRDREEELEAQELARIHAEQEIMNAPVEAAAKPTGLFSKKRKHHPRREAPKATKKKRNSVEARGNINRE